MNPLEVGAMFLSGFISGMVVTCGFVFYIGNKALVASKKKLEELGEQISTEGTKYSAIEGRMKRIKEIASLQMDLQGAADGPQRNAMDGKYKNSLMGKMKELEEEKVSILNSILKDGFDPQVSLLKEDGTTEIVKLSEFLAGEGEFVPPAAKDAKVKQVGKFTVLKGGKDDGSSSGTPPTTH